MAERGGMAAPPQAPAPGRVPHHPVAARAPLPRPVPGVFGHLLKAHAKRSKHPLLPPPTPKTKARTEETQDASPAPSPPLEPKDGDRRDLLDDGHRAPEPPEAMLDPTVRHLAALAPPPNVAPAATVADAPATHARLSLEELMPLLVKRIAWSGDRHQGSVRLEIGAGAYAGTTVIVHTDVASRVRIEVGGHGDLDGLRARLDRRLRRHGLDVESVT